MPHSQLLPLKETCWRWATILMHCNDSRYFLKYPQYRKWHHKGSKIAWHCGIECVYISGCWFQGKKRTIMGILVLCGLHAGKIQLYLMVLTHRKKPRQQWRIQIAPLVCNLLNVCQLATSQLALCQPHRSLDSLLYTVWISIIGLCEIIIRKNV